MSALTITCQSVYTDELNSLPALGGFRQPAIFFSTLLDIRKSFINSFFSNVTKDLLSKNAEHNTDSGAESRSIVATK
jgi:hypothetical protein